MGALKKYMDYEARVLEKRKSIKAIPKRIKKFEKEEKRKGIYKKKLSPKQKKMIRKVRAKRFLKTLPNPYRIKI